MSCKGQKSKLRFRKLEHRWLRRRTWRPAAGEPESPEGGKQIKASYAPAVGGGFWFAALFRRAIPHIPVLVCVCVQAAGAVRSHDHGRRTSSHRNRLLCDNSCVEKKNTAILMFTPTFLRDSLTSTTCWHVSYRKPTCFLRIECVS